MIIHDVEQNSPEWMKLRAGIPTASVFSKLVTSKGVTSKSLEAYAATLAAEKYVGGPVEAWEGNEHTERGHALEIEAIKDYEIIHKAKVERVGFVTSDDGTMGCSPDCMVGDDGMMEVKCLKAENHVAAIIRHAKDGTTDPKYYQQTQGQMMICERKWCDLAFYHPTLPMLVVRQIPNHIFCESLALEIETVVIRRDEILEVLQAM